jgi:NADH dehydrogenase FAD-containing subunit
MRANPLSRYRSVGQAGPDAPHVLIVGAGFVGFHCARELKRRLRPGEARVTLASLTDDMLYSPLLPHVAAGILTPADVVISRAGSALRARSSAKSTRCAGAGSSCVPAR